MNDWPDHDALLGRFRQWLEETRAEARSAGELEEIRDGQAAEPGSEIGLFQLAEQFTALRHELKLQTKSSRNLEDRTHTAIQAMEQAAEALRAAESRQVVSAEGVARPLAEALAELDEALQRGRKAADAARQRFLAELQETLLDDLDDRFQTQSAWRKWCSRRWYRGARALLAQRVAWADVEVFGSLLQGYALVQNRLRRALEQHHIQAIPCVGRPVDPNRMTVVDLTDDSGFPPGHVAEEIRPGYLWNGAVLRYAEVKAVRNRAENDASGEPNAPER